MAVQGWSDAALRRWALALFAVVVGLALVNPALGQGVQGHPQLTHPDVSVVDYSASLFVVLMGIAGLLVLWFRPRHSVGWLLCVIGLIEDLTSFGQTYGQRAAVFPQEHLVGGLWVMALSAPLWLPSIFLPVTSLLLRYPSGQVEGRWARRVEHAIWLGLGLVWAGYAIGDHAVTDELSGAVNPIAVPPIFEGLLMGAGGLLVVPGTVFCFLHTARRTWHATYPERQQLAWLVTVAPVAIGVFFLPWGGAQRLAYLVPFAVVIGVLRYRLAGIEVVVRRALLYGALTGLVLLVFVAVTAMLSTVVRTGGVPTVVAAGLVAVSVVPLRDRLQRVVDRFVYGDRGDPLAALRRLGTPVGGTTDEAMLPEVLAAVATALRVPGAELIGERGTHAVVGVVVGDFVDLPLVMGGHGVGVLRLAPRQGEARLPAADRRLVEGLAPLLAAVLHAVELAAALHVEQERVVAATATERARLRQELHDGLGPSLTGIGLGLEALESRVGASELVQRLRAETASSLEEVRRIIDGLRPGALETADLLSLLRSRARSLSASGPVQVRIDGPPRLPALPDELETAALRVVDEALTNVLRHAAATTCVVSVALDDALRVEVRDNGHGYDGPRPGGVGIGSMAARAQALGGCCEVTGSPAGTCVSLVLPLPRQTARSPLLSGSAS